jgi:hypothetical protein
MKKCTLVCMQQYCVYAQVCIPMPSVRVGSGTFQALEVQVVVSSKTWIEPESSKFARCGERTGIYSTFSRCMRSGKLRMQLCYEVAFLRPM